jgi:protein-disulfide isomerase
MNPPIKEKDTLVSWLMVILLAVNIVLSTVIGIRVLDIQQYLPEFAEHIEEHFASLPANSPEQQDENAAVAFDGDISIAGEPIQGNPQTAQIVIVEFADYECPYCAQATQLLKETMSQYGDKVLLVYKDYPLPFHTSALPAAKAATCAGEQGQYWEMHDSLYQNQNNLALENLKQQAETLGLEMAQFNACLDSQKVEDDINQNLEEGKALQIMGTPAFIVGTYQTSAPNLLTVTGYKVFQSDLQQKINELLGEKSSNP